MRRLFSFPQLDEPYNGTGPGTFVPLSELDALGLTAPIRIVPIWDVVTGGDQGSAGPYECSSVGQTILVHSAASVTDPLSNYFPSFGFCTSDHVVGRPQGTARLQAMQSRTQQAADYFKSALRLRPVGPGGITIDPSILANFNLDASRTVHNADLVLIMTARPSPNSPVAGFASCLQMDQFHRCTVAWFNW